METVGACKNIAVNLRVLGSRRQSLIVGSGGYQLDFSGSVQNPNSDNAGATSAIDVNSTQRDIEFNNMTVESALADRCYDLVAGNQVVLNHGAVYPTGSSVVVGPVPPATRHNVKGYP